MLETRDSSLPIQHRFLLRVFTTVGNPATFPTYKSPFNISNAQVFFYTDLTQSKWSLCMHKRKLYHKQKRMLRNFATVRLLAEWPLANLQMFQELSACT